MEMFEATVKKRGNSVWIIIPKNVVKKENIVLGKKINVGIVRDNVEFVK